jgi:phosphoribosylformylglycinamidine synthase subunit PurS
VTDFRVEVRVTPRRGILDPQGSAVQGALRSLGFGEVGEVHVGRLIVFTLAAADEGEAGARAEAMCRQLLANPVTEDFDVRVEALAAA